MFPVAWPTARALRHLYGFKAWRHVPARPLAESAEPPALDSPEGATASAQPAESAPLQTGGAGLQPALQPAQSASAPSPPQADASGSSEAVRRASPRRKEAAGRAGKRAPGRKAAPAPAGPASSRAGSSPAEERVPRPSYTLRMSVGLVGSRRDVNTCITLRDVQRFFSGLNVSQDDIKPYIDDRYLVKSFQVKFGSREDLAKALARQGLRLGAREVTLMVTRPLLDTRHWWSHNNPLGPASSRGRYVMVVDQTGLQKGIRITDVLSFFHGFDLMASVNGPVHTIREGLGPQQGLRPQQGLGPQQGPPAADGWGDAAEQGVPAVGAGRPQEQAHSAFMVRFVTAEEAARAVRMRNGGFIGNARVSMRVLA